MTRAIPTLEEIKSAISTTLMETELPACRRESDRMERVESALLKLTEIITGNGDASKGLVVKTDRNEQAISDLKKAQDLYNSRAWAIIMIGIGLLGTSIWNIISP